MVEVEIRSFIDENKYKELIKFFKKNGQLVAQDKQETYYFEGPQDLRIQKNEHYAKVWLKKGKIHDEAREEIEIKTDKNDFNKLEKLFLSLDYKVKIKWFRTRHEFKWKEINVCVDYTKGYGYILELEKMSTEKEQNKDLKILKEKMTELKVTITPKSVFEEKFNYYEANWKSLT